MSAPAGSPTITQQVIDRVRAIDHLDADTVAAAAHCILDTLGAAIGGSREPVVMRLRAASLNEGAVPVAGVWGTGERVSRSQAALINGTAAHALDFDDVSAAMEGHPSAPMLPALLAVAEGSAVTGAEVIRAFVVGFETEALIGRLMSPSHYARGFHTTATVGAFGAAAAGAQLLALPVDAWCHAFGLAGAQASGLKSMFGTMAKPLQVGVAAQNGVRAVTWAAAGVEADTDVLGSLQGFRDTQSEESGRPAAWDRTSLAVNDVLFKYHAACYLTHSAIEGVLALRGEGLEVDDVQSIRLIVPPGHLRVCNIEHPRTPLEGKFSLRFVAALALSSGDLSEAAFTEERLGDPALAETMDRVRVEPRSDEVRSAVVSVERCDGTWLTVEVDVNAPTPPDRLGERWTALVRKFRSLADPVVGATRAEAIVAAVEHLERAPSASPLLRALGMPAPADIRVPLSEKKDS
ncbi:MmgE/PrpD family protein [Microbacterium trichothecenolyticum]|uniref:2-methylcitrate dehydratase n=1 Tax=Microbacterium trichothecenolyticum TaxID=69370 RepID=A0A0M2HCC1_MICTR|nr:MmgE/PrpD family protein [Microbacterium trichothecenolyticum]KJL42338.1 2-methylcitrate dehydratase [Microbacterium trichothecenolyticum]